MHSYQSSALDYFHCALGLGHSVLPADSTVQVYTVLFLRSMSRSSIAMTCSHVQYRRDNQLSRLSCHGLLYYINTPINLESKS